MVVEADEHTFQLVAEAPRLEVHVGADDFEHDPGKLGNDEGDEDDEDDDLA